VIFVGFSPVALGALGALAAVGAVGAFGAEPDADFPDETFEEAPAAVGTNAAASSRATRRTRYRVFFIALPLVRSADGAGSATRARARGRRNLAACPVVSADRVDGTPVDLPRRGPRPNVPARSYGRVLRLRVPRMDRFSLVKIDRSGAM
jgi:hypothetical protein